MIDVMIDIETLGTTPGCAILAIAAVPFNSHTPLEYFYEKISQESCLHLGLFIDTKTVDWWAHQSGEAREEAFSGVNLIVPTLVSLSEYLKTLDSSVRVWGNGASFDVPILEAAYSKAEMEPPWKYYNSLCYRTLKNLFKALPYIPPKIKHNALEDAKAQAAHAERIFRFIKT